MQNCSWNIFCLHHWTKKSFKQTNLPWSCSSPLLAEWGWINSERVGQKHIKNFLGSASGIFHLNDVRSDPTMHAGTQILKSPSMIRYDQCLALDTRLPPLCNKSWVSILDSICGKNLFVFYSTPKAHPLPQAFPFSPLTINQNLICCDVDWFAVSSIIFTNRNQFSCWCFHFKAGLTLKWNTRKEEIQLNVQHWFWMC